jgi:peptidyl-prolyl cis-trans isomerase C
MVNDRPISFARLEASYEAFISQFGEMAPPGEEEALRVRRVLLDRLIDQELMMQEVERKELSPSAEEIQREAEIVQGELQAEEFKRVLGEAGYSLEEWKEKLLLDLAVERLQQDVVYEAVTVSEKEIETYLEDHRTDFEEPEQVRASQILVKTREEAVEARKRIRSGEDFADVAREVSLSPDAEEGGDLGFFSRGQMPQEFEAVVFSLSRGKLSSVVETSYGHHLFLLTESREARQRSDAEVQEEVRQILFAEKAEEAFHSWMRTLRSDADIRYNRKIEPR